jgi:glycosyltransferase involved in cell wall biosynthesis
LRIVYLLTRSDSIGGAQIHVCDLASAMQARGHEVTVLVGGSGALVDEFAKRGIPFRTLRHLARPIRPHTDVRALVEIRAALEELKPDLLTTHSSKAGILGRLAAWWLRIPVIFTAHGFAFTTGIPPFKAWMFRWIEWLAAGCCSRIVAVSEVDRQLALRYRVASSRKLVTIHYGMRDVDASLRAEPGSEPPRLITIARFERQKDPLTLIRALAGLKHLEWSLDIVGGTGPLQPSSERLVGRLGLRERVNILGMRTDVSELMNRSQLFLLISNWEGFPMSILEAMRAGLPVIASDVGGCRESVVEGETGFLIPRADVATLEQRLSLAIGDPALRARMGEAGRRRYEERFTFGRMLADTLAVYPRVINGDW